MGSTIRIKNDIFHVPAQGRAKDHSSDPVTLEMTGDDVVSDTQLIGTSDEALTKGEIGTLGWVKIENLDGVNFVQIGLTGSYTVDILAGDPPASFRASAPLFAKADTASVLIRKTFFEK